MKSLYLSRTKTNLKMTDKVLAIIPGAGIGERFQSDIPKQYEYLDGQSVIEKTIKPFIESEFISKILIAVSKSDNFIKEQNFFDNEKVEIVEGGDTRAISVLNALNETNENYDYVITHDAARPNITAKDLVVIYEKITSSRRGWCRCRRCRRTRRGARGRRWRKRAARCTSWRGPRPKHIEAHNHAA